MGKRRSPLPCHLLAVFIAAVFHGAVIYLAAQWILREGGGPHLDYTTEQANRS